MNSQIRPLIYTSQMRALWARCSLSDMLRYNHYVKATQYVLESIGLKTINELEDYGDRALPHENE